MKHFKIIIAMALLAMLILAGCGNRVGNNTLGATGGGDNGYGYLSASPEDLPTAANTEIGPQPEQAPASSDAAR